MKTKRLHPLNIWGSNQPYLLNLFVCRNSANEAWPKPLGDVIDEPESPEGGLVELVPDVQQDVVQVVVGLRVDHVIWHEGRDENLSATNLEGHLKLLKELYVLELQRVGDTEVPEEVGNLDDAWVTRAGRR